MLAYHYRCATKEFSDYAEYGARYFAREAFRAYHDDEKCRRITPLHPIEIQRDESGRIGLITLFTTVDSNSIGAPKDLGVEDVEVKIIVAFPGFHTDLHRVIPEPGSNTSVNIHEAVQVIIEVGAKNRPSLDSPVFRCGYYSNKHSAFEEFVQKHAR